VNIPPTAANIDIEISSTTTSTRYQSGFYQNRFHFRCQLNLVSIMKARAREGGLSTYKILSTGGEADNFKAIAEVVAQRYQRLLNEEKPLPELIPIDGGRGQVSAACRENEEFWQPGFSEAVKLTEGDPAPQVLQSKPNGPS